MAMRQPLTCDGVGATPHPSGTWQILTVVPADCASPDAATSLLAGFRALRRGNPH
jgi:hypothetical protein